MHDTSSQLTQRMAQMIAQKSPAQRLRMAADMYDMGKKLARAGITRANPHLNHRELKVRLFERLYGDDFSPEHYEKIVRYFARH
jgi:hypothetical protein